LNGDGAADVVAGNSEDAWVELSGSGGYTRVSLGGAGAPALADVDGDGVLDAVTSRVDAATSSSQTGGTITLAVARGVGRGAFDPFVSRVVSTDVTSVAVLALTDVDGDHVADLVVGVARPDPGPTPWSSPPIAAVRVYRGSATGFASAPRPRRLRRRRDSRPGDRGV
jgi:hypothetical protein